MQKNIRIVLLAGATLSLLAVPAMAQSSRTSATAQTLPQQPDPRVTLLEQELRDVQAQVADLKKSQADLDNSAALADLKRSTSDQYVDINNQIAGLPKVGLDNGRFTVASADGNFTLALRALIQYDYGYYAQGKNGSAAPDLSSGANFRRTQIGFTGTVWHDWSYNLTLDFAGNGVEKSGYIYAAYIEYDGFKPFAIRVGAYTPPEGLEDQTGSADLLFMERASAVDAARNVAGSPSRDAISLIAAGDDYFAAVSYTGNKVGDTGAFDEQQAVVGRVTWLAVNEPSFKWVLDGDFSHVFKPADIVAGTPASIATALSAISLSAGPELATDNNGPKTINTGNIDASKVTSFGAESAAEYDSFYVQGGYFNYQIDRRNPAIVSPNFDGFYALATWSLTGETHAWDPATGTFRGIRPAHGLGSGGLGAWELKARYSHLDLDYDPLSAASAGGVPGGVQNVWTLGANWYATNGIRFEFEYSNLHDHHVNAPTADISADEFGFRAQLSL